MQRRLSVPLLTAVVLLSLVVGAPALDGSSGAGTAETAEMAGTSQERTVSADFSGVTPLQHLIVRVLVAAICLGALGVGLRSYGRDDYVLAVVSSVGMLVAATFVVGSQSAMSGGVLARAGDLTARESAGGAIAGTDSLWLVGVAGSVLAVGVALLCLRLGTSSRQWTEREEEPETGAEDTDPEPTEIGAAAGRAADTLDSPTELDDAVVRAWAEMTAVLDLDDAATSTPGEFAEAAVAAGMAPDDVETLTTLFESVRYGGQPTTDERRRQAETALRNVERAYGDDS